MNIDASSLGYRELNKCISEYKNEIIIDNCIGQRFIASGLSQGNIVINGTPGNALGAYLDGAIITVNGNVQDAVGDTMNSGTIIVNGDSGDALGYSMRGGRIYVKGNSGYRTGIHMKEYNNKKPVIVIGGGTGSFLGEYLAGGIIIILGLSDKRPILGNFIGTGMHGGKILVRCKELNYDLPTQVCASFATDEDLKEVSEYLQEFANIFSMDLSNILDSSFYVLKANVKNPYKQLYTYN